MLLYLMVGVSLNVYVDRQIYSERRLQRGVIAVYHIVIVLPLVID